MRGTHLSIPLPNISRVTEYLIAGGAAEALGDLSSSSWLLLRPTLMAGGVAGSSGASVSGSKAAPRVSGLQQRRRRCLRRLWRL